MRCERSLRRLRNGFLCQRMRQRLKCDIVLQYQMLSFISLDEDEDRRDVVRSDVSLLKRRDISVRRQFRRGTACCARRCNVRRARKILAWRHRIVSSDVTTSGRRDIGQREPMRIHKSRCVAMPSAERRQVVAFSSHLRMEPA